MEEYGVAALEGCDCVRGLQALREMLPMDDIRNWRDADQSVVALVRYLIGGPSFCKEQPPTQLMLLAYALFLDEPCQLVSVEAMSEAGFDFQDYYMQGFNNELLRDVMLVDFLDHFIYSFGTILPQFKLEFYNMTSVLKNSGKFFKQLFDKQFKMMLSRIFCKKSEAQFFILDIKYRIDNLTISISEFNGDVRMLTEQLTELQQLLYLAYRFLCDMERAGTYHVDVSGIDITPLAQLLLENFTYIIQYPCEKNLTYFQDVVLQCQRIAEIAGDILFQSSQLEAVNGLKPKIEFDSPQDSRKVSFHCRKLVVTYLLETFFSVLYIFTGYQYLVEFMVYIASHFYTLVNQMNFKNQWVAVSKQDKESIKNIFCGSCVLIKEICKHDLTANYFPIISFFDMALTLFSSHIIFLDRIFMDILISIIFSSKQTGLIYKAQSIVAILFRQQCAVNYVRTHYSLFIGQQHHYPSSVLDMIYALYSVVII